MHRFRTLFSLLWAFAALALSSCGTAAPPPTAALPTSTQPAAASPTLTPLLPDPSATAAPPTPGTDAIYGVSTPPPTETPTETPPGPLVVAAIGDYGLQGEDAAAVAALVKSWLPDLVITLGDNNYPAGAAETIDENIGQYYSEFIYPYTGAYGPGASENRFFPSPGNHDWMTADLQPYLDYFTLPGNERYYDFVRGPVHFFALDSDTNEPDGVGRSTAQAQWLQAALAASTAPWQIVYMHHAPFSSSHHGSTDYIQWPFAEWGADAVLAGHDHVYERLIIDGIPYIVNGIGGYPDRYFFFQRLDGSQVQYRSGHGALRITATDAALAFEMFTTTGELLDSQTLTASAGSGAAPVITWPDPAAYTWLEVASGYRSPLLLTHAGDGSDRLFVVEQAGIVRIIGQETPFLDISSRLTSSGFEQGLLGLAFDPTFGENGFFYVNYTDPSGSTVISRFQVFPDDPGRADPDSETVLLRVQQPYANHNGGHLAFGPDGLLYAGLGDGGSAGDPQGNAQNPASLLGKLLRIDPATGAVDIYASGLRNPWRFSFDRLTGDLYLGDVGQSQWEEINFLPAGTPPGVNFGWKYFEAGHPYEGEPPAGVELVGPVLEYNHAAGGCSVTGGHVYRGPALPAFYGVYLFSDYCAGAVWGLVRDGADQWTSAELFPRLGLVTSFGEDEDGELYLVTQEGVILKLVSR